MKRKSSSPRGVCDAAVVEVRRESRAPRAGRKGARKGVETVAPKVVRTASVVLTGNGVPRAARTDGDVTRIRISARISQTVRANSRGRRGSRENP
jgi:hypothetical protein